MAAEWFYQVMGQELGPVGSAELRRLADTGIVEPDMLVRKGVAGRWVWAREVQGLFKRSDSPPPLRSKTAISCLPPAPPTAQEPGDRHEAMQPASSPDPVASLGGPLSPPPIPGSRLHSKWRLYAALVGVAGVAAIAGVALLRRESTPTTSATAPGVGGPRFKQPLYDRVMGLAKQSRATRDAEKEVLQACLVSMVEGARSVNNRYATTRLSPAEETFLQREIPEITRGLENLADTVLKAPLTDENGRLWIIKATDLNSRLAECGRRLKSQNATRAELFKKVEDEYLRRVPFSVAKLKDTLGPPDGIVKSGPWCQLWTYVCEDGKIRFQIHSLGGSLGGADLDDDTTPIWLEPADVEMF